MKAAGVTQYGGLEQLRQLELPTPAIDPENGVLIRVHGAGVGQWDAGIVSGASAKTFGRTGFPVIPGVEVAGVVEAVGSQVGEVRPGDEVYTYFFGASGGFAEYAAAVASEVAPKPKSLSFAQAAALPVASITALMAIEETLRVQSGELVLVAGAAGAVGSLAVQFAKLAGARVIGTASGANADYVRGLGADEFVDYTQGDVAQQVRGTHPNGVDVGLDTVGGPSVELTAKTVRSGGRFADITGTDAKADPSIQASHVWSEASRERLIRIGELVDSGRLRLEIGQLFPLARARDALARVTSRHGRGKVVLEI